MYIFFNKAEESRLNRENLKNLGTDLNEFKYDIVDKIDNIENKQKKQLDGLKIILEKGSSRFNNTNLNLINKVFSDNPQEVEEAKNAYIKPTKIEFKMAINEVNRRNHNVKMTIQDIQINSMIEAKLKKNEEIKNKIINKDTYDDLNLQKWKMNKIFSIKEKIQSKIHIKNIILLDKIKKKLSDKNITDFK